MEASSGVLPPAVALGQRRVAPSPLPRTYFIYEKQQRRVLGAFLLSECASFGGQAYWRVDRVCLFEQAAELPREALSWISTLVHIKPEVEFDLRTRVVQGGGRLLDHFPGNQTRWWAWPITPAQLDLVVRCGPRGLPFSICSALSMSKAAGVTPQVVRRALSPIG